MKILLLNGPPRAGKDTAGKLVLDIRAAERPGAWAATDVWKLAAQLKECTHGAYKITDEDGNIEVHDKFEDVKDEPSPLFMGLTPRQAYINFCQDYLKKHHGEDVLGRILTDQLLEYRLSLGLDEVRDYLAVVTDNGFRGEAEHLVNTFGPTNVFLIQVDRKGCSFESDSRGWVRLDDIGVVCTQIPNNGTEESLRYSLWYFLKQWNLIRGDKR